MKLSLCSCMVARSTLQVGGMTMELSEFSKILVSNSFLLLVAMPGAPSSVLVPSSDALCS